MRGAFESAPIRGASAPTRGGFESAPIRGGFESAPIRGASAPTRDDRVDLPMRGALVGDRERCWTRRSDAGQAAVELVAGLPALLLVAAIVMQLLAVGYTAVLAGDAAEAGALAMARGGAPTPAARSSIPGWARGGMEVTRAVGAVHVQMRPPRLVPWVGDLLHVRASAAVAAPGRTGLLP